MIPLDLALASIGSPAGTAVTLGTFDGVHLGHRRLLKTVYNAAEAHGLTSVAIAFRKQPRSIINPALTVTYLASLDRRLRLIKATGVGKVIPVDFDDSIRTLSARQFICKLRERASMRRLVTGPGARMGHDRAGAELLSVICAAEGIDLDQVSPAETGGVPVSSTGIRNALAAGDLATACSMLGRNYTLDGKVVAGERRGRKLGFPTANIEPEAGLVVPADGIYAAIVEFGGVRRMAATSIGVRPTFGAGARTVEAYVLDFEGDLYGRDVSLEFASRLRGELKFDGPEPLVAQMRRDVEETRTLLSSAI